MNKIKENLKFIIPIIVLIILVLGLFAYFYLKENNNKNIIIEQTELIKEEKKEIQPEEIYYYVDIKGAVNNEGVYKLKEGSRVIDVINESGGLKENADTSIINLSKKIKDEMFIIIYTKEEVQKYKEQTISTKEINKKLNDQILVIDENNDANAKTIKSSNNNEVKEEKININTASKEELLTLTGIGESKADSIISYREENGEFKTIEDIKNVSGIGDSLFEKIKGYITT